MDIIPLISVIVPIYNVAPYVRKCLDSLKNQTMKEIEVICIDDGSTDDSGRIADEYESQEWPIFRVFHTENRGLSAARNRGIDETKSNWIMFVDSDDWVDEDFCRVPYEAALVNEADMVVFDCYEINEAVKKTIDTKKKMTDSGLINHETAVDNGGIIVWNKLYKKELFCDYRFIEEHVYEDIGITHLLIYGSNTIYRIHNKLYYRNFRKGSISRSLCFDVDRFDMSKRRYTELVDFGYPQKKAFSQLVIEALRFYGRTPNISDSRYYEASDIINSLGEIPKEFTIKERIKLVIWRTNKHLYRLLYKAVIKRLS